MKYANRFWELDFNLLNLPKVRTISGLQEIVNIFYNCRWSVTQKLEGIHGIWDVVLWVSAIFLLWEIGKNGTRMNAALGGRSSFRESGVQTHSGFAGVPVCLERYVRVFIHQLPLVSG